MNKIIFSRDWIRVVLVLLTLGFSNASEAKKILIGISMPNSKITRWNNEGKKIATTLEAKGYEVYLQNAQDNSLQQLEQVEKIINAKASILLIAAVDGNNTILNDSLRRASASKMKIIAYDRLIMNTPNIDYFITHDNRHVGVLQALSLEKALGLREGKGPFNIELFAGPLNDNNSFLFFDGAMSILQKYLDSGKLVIKSKQVDFQQVSIFGWDNTIASARIKKIILDSYKNDILHAVLSPYDGMSISIIDALKTLGYEKSGTKILPFISGQDAELNSVKSIVRNEQYSTILKDSRELVKITVNMIDDVAKGKSPKINDIVTYNNKSKIVPSFLLQPVLVDANNYEKTIIESGYFKKEEIR